MRDYLPLFLAVTLPLSACTSATPDEVPAEPILSTITATPMAGPFADGADFCAKLGKNACEPNEQLLMLISGHKEPLKLRAGQQLQLSTYASRDAASQQAHLLISYNGSTWALPAISPHDPAKGARVLANTMRFAQDEAESMGDDVFVIHLSTSQEAAPGGEADFHELQYHCKAGQTLQCARIETSWLLLDGMDSLNMVRGATVLPLLKEGGKRVEIMDLGAFQYGDKHDMTRRETLLKEGNHALIFP